MLPRGKTLILLILLPLLGQLAYSSFGVRIIHETLYCHWQYLDPPLLRNRLLESVWYLHSQPPLFNLMLGLGLKLGGEAWPALFHLLYIGLGLVITIALYVTMSALGVSRVLAASLAISFSWTPGFIVYEHLLFYTFPEAALLCTSAAAFALFLSTSLRRYLALFFLSLTLLCLMRSAYHLVFLFFVALWLARALPLRRQLVVSYALVACLPVLGLYIKNWTISGTFGPSSWLGMNLANNLNHFVSTQRLRGLEERGVISGMLAYRAFMPLSHYAEKFPTGGPLISNIPALSADTKNEAFHKRDARCEVNFNHAHYADISREYLRDTLALLRHDPGPFFLRALFGLNFYFYPSTRYYQVAENVTAIATWNEALDRTLLARIQFDAITIDEQRLAIYPVLLVGLPVLFFIMCAIRFGRRKGEQSREESLLLSYLLMSTTYLSLVFIAVEVPENNRFRFALDPFFVVFFGVAIQHLRKARRTK